MPVFFEYINFIWMSILAFILDFLQPLLPLFIGILMLVFIGFYCIPALFLWLRLGRLKKNLRDFRKNNVIEYPTDLFKSSKLFIHLWTEYQQTLHEQRGLNPQTGIEELVAIRSTTPAEIFFGPSVLVDGRLHTEFFKHLPGILTGLGIIGTFLGLIHGLQAFQINENTEVIRQSLEQLLHGVYEAFLVSMVAIFLAMFVTIVEKSLLSKLYGKVEELCFLIDSLYESGAGEEYLQRLVKSSESSASQANIIKDALVGELKEILYEVTQRQIQSTLSSQQQLGDQFRDSIQAGISQPLQKIAAGFDDQRESTGKDLSSALDDVFAAFTQRLQDLFGGQTTGIQELQQQTVEALQATAKQFQQMATNIDATGRNTTNAMTETLAQAMKAMELRQQAMNEQMTDFLGQVRTMGQASQNETGQKLQTLLGNLGQQMTKMVAELQTQSRSANDDHQGRQQQMADATIAAITRLSSGVETSLQTMQGQLTGMLTHLEQQTQSTATHHQEQQRQLTAHNQQAVQALTASVNETVDKVSTETTEMLAKLTSLVESHQLAAAEAVRSIQAAINQMSEVTTSALRGMNQGAENLIIATDDFSKAGQSVAGVLHEATGVATKLSLSADAVSISTRAMETIVGDYSTVRQQLNDMIQALKGTVESARKEASLTADVLTRIDHATQKLATAQNQADRYLAQVSEVLEETHQQFASSMRSTLNEANQQFFQHLTGATALLRGSIEELDAALGNVSTRK
jgi:hypothetical protein